MYLVRRSGNMENATRHLLEEILAEVEEGLKPVVKQAPAAAPAVEVIKWPTFAGNGKNVVKPHAG